MRISPAHKQNEKIPASKVWSGKGENRGRNKSSDGGTLENDISDKGLISEKVI